MERLSVLNRLVLALRKTTPHAWLIRTRGLKNAAFRMLALKKLTNRASLSGYESAARYYAASVLANMASKISLTLAASIVFSDGILKMRRVNRNAISEEIDFAISS